MTTMQAEAFQAVKKSAVAKKKIQPVVSANKVRIALTAIMGVVIPLLSVTLSTISGTLAHKDHVMLAAAAFALMASVLYVSLAHLAWAIEDITKSDRKSSWALAIAFDLCLVLGETVHVYADDCGLSWLVTTMMVGVCVLSMALNVYAFFFAPKVEAKKARQLKN